MSQDSRINKQIALTIICVILSSALFVVAVINFERLWLKIVLSSILAVLLVALIFLKTVAFNKGEKQK